MTGNMQQAAAIYVRHVLHESHDKLLHLIHEDFRATHNVDAAETDSAVLVNALTAVLDEITLHVTGGQIRHATDLFVTRAWDEDAGRLAS